MSEAGHSILLRHFTIVGGKGIHDIIRDRGSSCFLLIWLNTEVAICLPYQLD